MNIFIKHGVVAISFLAYAEAEASSLDAVNFCPLAYAEAEASSLDAVNLCPVNKECLGRGKKRKRDGVLNKNKEPLSKHIKTSVPQRENDKELLERANIIIKDRAEQLKPVCEDLFTKMSDISKKLFAKIKKTDEKHLHDSQEKDLQIDNDCRWLSARAFALSKTMNMYKETFSDDSDMLNLSLGIIGLGAIIKELEEVKEMLEEDKFKEYKIENLSQDIDTIKKYTKLGV